MKPARWPLQIREPYKRGLVHASAAWQATGFAFDYSGEKRNASLLGGANWTRNENGIIVNTAGTSGSYVSISGLGNVVGVSNPWTLIIRGNIDEAPALKGLFNLRRGPGAADRLGLAYWNTSGNNGVSFAVRDDFTTNYVSLSSYPDITVPHTYIFTHDGANNRTNAFIYVDGEDLTQRTVNSSLTPWGTDSLTLGEGINASLNADTNLEYWLLYNYQWSAAQAKAFSQDPYEWMRPEDTNPAIFASIPGPPAPGPFGPHMIKNYGYGYGLSG